MTDSINELEKDQPASDVVTALYELDGRHRSASTVGPDLLSRVAAMLEHPDEEVRATAIQVLGVNWGSMDHRALFVAALADPSPFVRQEAMHATATLAQVSQDLGVARFLTDVALDDTRLIEQRRDALTWASRILLDSKTSLRNSRLMRRLFDDLLVDPSRRADWIQANAEDLASSFEATPDRALAWPHPGSPNAEDSETGHTPELVTDWLEDAAPRMRNAGLTVAGALRFATVEPLVRELAANDPDQSVRGRALRTLGRISTTALAGELATAASHDADDSIRRAAVSAMGLLWWETGDAQPIRRLGDLLDEASGIDRSAIAATIACVSGGTSALVRARPGVLDPPPAVDFLASL